MDFHVHLAKDGNIADLSGKLFTVATNLYAEKEKSLNNTALSAGYFQVDRELSEWREILV